MTEGPDEEAGGTVAVALLVGSLRAGSWNRLLAGVLVAAAPARWAVQEVPVRDLPHYDEDLDGGRRPPEVRRFIDALAGADALLVVTPEYNLGMPGLLKNALDWASRPVFEGPLVGAPAAVAGIVTSRRHGPERSLDQARTTLAVCAAAVMDPPDLSLGSAGATFDAGGALVDPAIAEACRSFLDRFDDHISAVRTAP